VINQITVFFNLFKSICSGNNKQNIEFIDRNFGVSMNVLKKIIIKSGKINKEIKLFALKLYKSLYLGQKLEK
jgi:hypothetical protein